MRTEYQGGGEVGRLAEELDRVAAEAARIARGRWREWIGSEDARSRPVAERAGRVRRALGEALERAGFHRHKRGEWRRRREAMATAEATSMIRASGAGDDLQPALPASGSATADVGEIERRWHKRPGKITEVQAKALLKARPGMASDFSLSPSFDLLASLLDTLNADMVKREASRLKFFEVEAELAGPNPTPTEALLAENAALCWLDLNLRRARWADAELDGGIPLAVAAYCQKRIDAAHRRFLAAVKAIAVVRKLGVPDLRVSIDQRSVTVAGPPPPALDVGPG